jgi:hypothetical protein
MSTITVTNIKATGETVSRAVSGVAAAWVNFNGTGTVAIRDSANVSSLTDNATGDYSVNWTNSFGAVDYAPTGSSGPQPAVINNVGVSFQTDSGFATSFARLSTRRRDTNADVDVEFAFILAHGDLA